VTGFVALADSGLTTGDNIVAVWYVRDVATNTWTVKSWLTDDVTEAVKSVKIQAGIADSEDEHWDLDAPLSILAGENPEQHNDQDGLRPPIVTTTHTKWQLNIENCSCPRNSSGSCPAPGTCCPSGAFTATSTTEGDWVPPL